MVTDASRREGAGNLSDIFDNALSQLPHPSRSVPQQDGFLYSGNRHESVPRALFLDRRLTPLERNAWQVFRLLLNEDGVTAFPTYDQLRPWLASMPCSAQASCETVARAITLLRLTRWLSLVRRRRDARTGRMQSNLYVLHDEPLTPYEAMQLDPDYLGLVSQALAHSAKAVQLVGLNTLKEISEDPLLSGRTLPTRLQVLAQRLGQTDVCLGSYPQSEAQHDSEAGPDHPLRNAAAPTSDSEAGRKSCNHGDLRIPKQDRTVRKESIKEVRTVHAIQLRLPESFAQLKAEQQAGTMVALQQVDEDLRQPILDEWAARCRGNAVRNPAGYLFGLIQRAIHGQFKPWASQEKSAGAPATAPAEPPRAPASPEVVKQHLARLRELFNKR
ncbi:STY4528 family pathogenicity island replication protein [Pseudomonas chlororaphis]|uniref:STY4528 family pathogenicity island replication protein n=1 Tax=Pseudomonas chlororaphis TaxID=587753 RepID=UPI00046F5C30|nr:STY4528 family pathogenicity island replication protein [Pseudomonas chlororaphis]